MGMVLYSLPGIAPPYKSLTASKHLKVKNSSYGELRVDLEGFEPATSSVGLDIKVGEKGGKRQDVYYV